MNIFKIKRQVSDYLVGIEEKYEAAKKKSSEEIHRAISDRRAVDPLITFDQAAMDVILERIVEAEAVSSLVKGFLDNMDVT